jgi:hypothetical protein
MILDPNTKVVLQVSGVFNVRFTPRKQINTSLSLPTSIDAIFYNQEQIGVLEWGGNSQDNLLKMGLLMAVVDAHRGKILGEGWWKNQEREGFITTGYKQVDENFSGISYSRISFGEDCVQVTGHISADDTETKNKIYDEVSRFAMEINHPNAKKRFLEVKRIRKKVELPPTQAIWSV